MVFAMRRRDAVARSPRRRQGKRTICCGRSICRSRLDTGRWVVCLRAQLTHLTIYLDPDQRLGSLRNDYGVNGALPIYGLPISYIIDADGSVIGYLTGAANWDALEARHFLDYFISRIAR
jgi:hypothetical protein